MKVRIRKQPQAEEIDGVRLDNMTPGVVREVSPSIGSWLIAERYAEIEMRADVRTHEDDFLSAEPATDAAAGSGPQRDRVTPSTRRRRTDC